MGSNCGCGAGGNKARTRRAGFHLPAWAGLDQESMSALADLAPPGLDSDTPEGVGDTTFDGLDAGGEGIGNEAIRPEREAGTHVWYPCNSLYVDMLAHEAVLKALEAFLKHCQAQGLACEFLNEEYDIQHRALVDAQAEYENRCSVVDHVVGGW